MISQGYPLWAKGADDTTYAVVGWDANGYPLCVALGPAAHLGAAETPADALTFTTTDPTAVRYTHTDPDADLRQRMARLADLSASHGLPVSAAAIRQELDR